MSHDQELQHQPAARLLYTEQEPVSLPEKNFRQVKPASYSPATGYETEETSPATADRNESESKFHFLYQTMVQGVVYQDADGAIVSANPAAERILGLNIDQMQGRSSIDPRWKAIHEDGSLFPGETHPAMQALLTGQEIRDTVMGVFNPITCSYTWININAVPLFLPGQNKPFQVFTTFEDITERKLAMDALQQSEASLLQAQVLGQMGSWYYNIITDKITGSENFYRLLALPPSEAGFGLETIIGKLHPDDVPLVEEKLREVGSNREPVRLELRYRMPDGSIKWLQDSSIPILRDGKPVGVRGVNIDITDKKEAENKIRHLNANLEELIRERTAQLAETNRNLQKEIEDRVQAEKALQEKTNELEKFFNFSINLLCIADTSGNFLRVNKAWESLLGYSVPDLEKRQFLEFVHPDDLQHTLEAMSLLHRQQAVTDFTNRYRAKDGTYKYIEWHSVPVGNKIYAAARDITDRINAAAFEEELMHFSSQLAGISHSEIDNTVNESLSRMGQFLNADRAYIFLFNPDDTMSNTHEWCKSGIDPEIQNLQDIPNSLFPMWMATLERHENIIIPSVAHLPDTWQGERDILEPQGVKSLIVIPMLKGATLVGFVGLDSVVAARTYKTSEINTLRVWGTMLASLISKQKAEIQLENTRQNYQSFFNTIDDFIFVLDLQGNIVAANNAVYQRLGYVKEEILNRPVVDIHPPGRREEVVRYLDEILAGTRVFCSLPLITRSGRQIPVEKKIKRGYWNGQPVILSVSKDITPIKLSEEKFSTAFQSNPAMMAISVYDTGKFIDVNTAFTETLGYARAEVIGKSSTDLCIYNPLKLRDQLIAQLEQNKPVHRQEVQMLTKDGSVKTGLLSTDPIYIGEVKCLLTVVIDITERKKAEEESRKARQEAEEANMAKNEFLSRMSHELRTPMNSILGFAQLLGMGNLTPAQQKGVNHILGSGKHLLNLINEVLDLSRIEAGHLSLSPEPIMLQEMLAEMMDTIQPQATARQIKISMATGRTNVLADRQMLRQVILNLLNNAIKYNCPGGSVKVRTETIPGPTADTAKSRISITDTGPGIAPEHLDRLFRPFERIGAEKTTTEGTGLGLAVVKKLTDAMGGAVGVASTPGTGSTFWIELPLSSSQPDATDTTDNAVMGEAGTGGKKATVLYIEDNSSNTELVEQILLQQRPGIHFLTDAHGKQAAHLAAAHAPDLILLDLNLPDMHGSEVLRLLQKEEATRSIPVVVVSADAMPHQPESLLKAGARNYLTKPLDIIAFLAVVDEYVPA